METWKIYGHVFFLLGALLNDDNDGTGAEMSLMLQAQVTNFNVLSCSYLACSLESSDLIDLLLAETSLLHLGRQDVLHARVFSRVLTMLSHA